jgi:hypothetical protein
MGEAHGEGLAEVEASAKVSPQTDDASLLGLLRVLLHPRTLPHVVLLGLLGVALHAIAQGGNASLSSVGYLSLAGGYGLTAMLSSISTVKRWTTLGDDGADGNPLFRLLLSFKICVFPLLMALVSGLALVFLLGENGVLGDQTSTLPVVLAGCFVAWAVLQGRGFARWLNASLETRSRPETSRVQGRTLASALVSFVLLLVVFITLLVVFERLAGTTDIAGALASNIVFIGLFSAVFFLAWRRSQTERFAASSSSHLHAFAVRWMLVSQAFVSWHLLTVWRHWAIAPEQRLLLAEELLLMVFTVTMAIWALTSKSFKSPFQLVSKDNALPVGLAFGYAYAGSVAMMTVVLEDVRTVMMAGHLIVAVTVLMMQPSVLRGQQSRHETSENIRQIVDQVEVPAAAGGEGHSAVQQDAVEPDVAEVNETEGAPSVVEAGGDASIGEQVAWGAPEVLAEDVAWDDEVELID